MVVGSQVGLPIMDHVGGELNAECAQRLQEEAPWTNTHP